MFECLSVLNTLAHKQDYTLICKFFGTEITIKNVFPHPMPSVLFSMDSKDKINELRQKIDNLDDQMLDLLVQRFSVSKEIGEIKASSGINVSDPNREQDIIDRLADKLEGKLDKDDISAIFGPVYHISKKLQKK